MTYLTQWSARDRGLAEALIHHESGQHSCGHQWDRATHPDMNGWYEAEYVVCEACAAVEQLRKDDPDPEPGSQVVVRDMRPADDPLPSRVD